VDSHVVLQVNVLSGDHMKLLRIIEIIGLVLVAITFIVLASWNEWVALSVWIVPLFYMLIKHIIIVLYNFFLKDLCE
jgi:hypothetical protein